MVAELLQGKEQLRLEIKDDGRGFDLNQVEQACAKEATYSNNTHFGLIGMRERAKLLGGKLEIASYLGNGTQIELIVPLA
jgi:signal transduction histidine kinase